MCTVLIPLPVATFVNQSLEQYLKSTFLIILLFLVTCILSYMLSINDCGLFGPHHTCSGSVSVGVYVCARVFYARACMYMCELRGECSSPGNG